MKIQFDRDELTKALQRVATVVEKKSTMPILGNLLLETTGEKLSISATDLEIGIRCSCPVTVEQEGKVCVPARNFIEIIRELPEKTGQLQKTDNQWLNLESGNAQFKVVGVAAEEFPKMLSPKDFAFEKLHTEAVRNSIEKTAFAVSTDEMRYNLNGAYLERAKGEKGTVIRMVATDGHRLAMSDRPLEKGESFSLKKGVILPRKGIVELRRLLQEATGEFIEVAFTETNAAFQVDESVIYMRLIVGEFPDYNAVIPKGNKKALHVNSDLLSRSLKRVSLLSEGKSRCVRLDLRKKGVHLQANSPDVGEAQEDLQAEYEGEDLEIGFNARYLLDVLSVVRGGNVILRLNHSQSPGLINCPDDPGFTGVIMPMRI